MATNLIGAFPVDGSVQPFPAGQVEFDFIADLVRGGNGNFPIGLPTELRGAVESCTLFVDTLATVRLPDYGNVNFLTTGDRIEIPIHLDRLTVVSALPCNMAVIVTGRPEPPTLGRKSVPQMRTSAMTVTKVFAAGTADSWVDVIFVPVYEAKSISQGSFGKAPINCSSYPLKTFAIRNTSATSIETRIVGAMAEDIANASGDGQGYIVDQDAGGILKTGSADKNVVRTSTRWFLVKLQARVPAAIAAGTSTTFTVEYVGSPEAIVQSSASIPIGPAAITDDASTGTGAISLNAAPDASSRFVRMEVTFSTAPTASELLTLTIRPVRGTAYNAVWYSTDPSVPARTSIIWPGGVGYDMQPGDQLNLAYANTDARTYTARLIWESQTI